MIVGESNNKYGGNPVKTHSKKQKVLKPNNYLYDYRSSAWEKLISKTQQTNDFLTKGDYARASQRNYESEISNRIITPTSISNNTHNFERDLYSEPEPNHIQTERLANLNFKSTFKMSYTPVE